MNIKKEQDVILAELYRISFDPDLTLKTESKDIKKLVHKIKDENVLIHDIVDVPIYSENKDSPVSLYYSIACPNYQCDFIFDHPLDHYPFMLLIELARQVSIGVTHKYKDIPVDFIKNTIQGFNLKIHRFTELDYPLVIGCHDTIIKSKPSMQIRDLEFYYVQKGELCAEITSRVSIMSNQIYDRYRRSNRKQITEDNRENLITNLDLV